MTILNNKPIAFITYIEKDFDINQLQHPSWDLASDITVDTLWSGNNPKSNQTMTTHLLWSSTCLYVRFHTTQDEPAVINPDPILTQKTMQLWERDVCEIFIAPKPSQFRHYFEFEIAPTGEWIDLAIHQTPNQRITDWDYHSQMKTAAQLHYGANNTTTSTMAIAIEWAALGNTPKAGDIWLGNLFRAMGREPQRSYLAWSATYSATPNFHVPENFGRFIFI